MLRKIIKIDEERCNGCGLCANACHEGAIDIVDGKAKLMREHFCDGLGDCLPACPMNAISFEMREAPGYDEQAVLAAKREKEAKAVEKASRSGDAPNALDNWPVQLKLVSPSSPVFYQCDLLVAADCTAYAYGNFHRDFVAGKVVVIGCPEAGRGGLRREAHGDHPGERREERDAHAHVRPLLRRHGIRGLSGRGKRRAGSAPARGHDRRGRGDIGG